MGVRSRPRNLRNRRRSGPEEIADAEELIAQYVRDYRAGNQAVANEIMDQLKGVLQLRRDPILMYHIANGYDQVRRRRDALEYYRRFVAIETADPRLRRRFLNGLRF